MNDSKDHKAAAEPPLDCRVGHDTPRVEALIDRVMAAYPGITAHAQARYYEEVHQHLAPLARELERENARLRIGHQRYETARRMNQRQWADAWKLNTTTGKPFDEIIDDMRPFMVPNA